MPIGVLYTVGKLLNFPKVYDMPNIGVLYTIGKLLNPSFPWKCLILRTSSVFSPGVPADTPDGGSGSDITNEGLKLQTIGGQ